MSEIIMKMTEEVAAVERAFQELDLENQAKYEEFSEYAMEVLSKLKKTQDTEEYFDLNDDFEDLIFKVITLIGHLDKEVD